MYPVPLPRLLDNFRDWNHYWFFRWSNARSEKFWLTLNRRMNTTISMKNWQSPSHSGTAYADFNHDSITNSITISCIVERPYYIPLMFICICTMFFGRPFVKQLALCYRTVVLSVLYACLVCNIGVLWTNGSMYQDETSRGGRPRSSPHSVRWWPSSPQPHAGSGAISK